MVEVPLDVARVVLDVVVNSLDWGSGFLSTPEMQAVGAFSRAIGGPKVKCRTQTLSTLNTHVEECVLEIGHPGPHEWARIRDLPQDEGWA